MRRSFPIVPGLAICLLLTVPALAQFPRGNRAAPAAPALPTDSSPTPTPGRVAQWRATLPGGSFVVALRSIIAISLHEYIVDASARVTEMNVDTGGNALVRFYYLEPISPQTPVATAQAIVSQAQETGGDAAAQTDHSDIWKKVSKTYPGSTHAHTIEFRVESKEQLQKLFQSADRAWRQNTDDAVTIE